MLPPPAVPSVPVDDRGDDRPLWTPDPLRAEATRMAHAIREAAAPAGRALAGYDDLHAWSVAEPDAFWGWLADRWFPWRRRPERVRSEGPIDRVRWFEGGTGNVVDRLLDPDGVADDAPALIAHAEGAGAVRWSRARLRREVARVQAALHAAGVGPGDTVAAYAANVPEVVALFLACAADGVRFTSGSPDFGAEAAAARFAQVRPKALFASPESRYGGRRHDRRSVVEELAARLGTVRTAVALPVPGAPEAEAPNGFGRWEAWTHAAEAEAGDRPETRPLPFDQELYVLYSSGTTGDPKAIRHRAGGAFLTQWKEQAYHLDVRPHDRVLVTTTTGWMMWNWQVAALGVGATLVLIDGSPVQPGPERLWRIAEHDRVTHFCTSAGYLHRASGGPFRPAEADLSALRAVTSTGSPLAGDGFRWVYDDVKGDLHLASISGGTDIVGCFLLGVPTLPVHPGELQRPGLGVDLAVFGEDGRPLDEGAGELVCRAPLPSMPLGFVGDEDGRRFRAAYFERFDGVWTHGDRIERTVRGGFRHHGRSDATLNPGGVRIGSAEVTGPAVAAAEVADAAAVPKREGSDESIWLLIVPAPGAPWSQEAERRLRDRIRTAASPRHVPTRIVAVPDLPRTRSGKVIERALAALVNGEPVGPLPGAANPEALPEIERALRAAVDRHG